MDMLVLNLGISIDDVLLSLGTYSYAGVHGNIWICSHKVASIQYIHVQYMHLITTVRAEIVVVYKVSCMYMYLYN